jgi:hypothetical protein
MPARGDGDRVGVVEAAPQRVQAGELVAVTAAGGIGVQQPGQMPVGAGGLGAVRAEQVGGRAGTA